MNFYDFHRTPGEGKVDCLVTRVWTAQSVMGVDRLRFAFADCADPYYVRRTDPNPAGVMAVHNLKLVESTAESRC